MIEYNTELTIQTAIRIQTISDSNVSNNGLDFLFLNSRWVEGGGVGSTRNNYQNMYNNDQRKIIMMRQTALLLLCYNRY